MKISYYLPERILQNEELARLYIGWTSAKIFSKTGIMSRHVAGVGETALDMAEAAARSLFSEQKVDVATIDFVLFCTQSADYKLPTSACILQDRLGIRKSAGALDYNLGCSGFVYGLAVAKGLVVSGVAKSVLLVTAETYSKYIHPMDKSVRTIFGDGAAAVLVDETSEGEIGAFSLGTDGSGFRHLIVPTGGARTPVDQDAEVFSDASGNQRTKNDLVMNGPEIFNFTLDVVPSTMVDVLAKNGLAKADVDLFVFHQANKFMLETIRKANVIPKEKFYVNLEDTGNTVSSTIPIALRRAQVEGRLKAGMRVLIMGFGVGLSWGATVLTWR